MKTLFHLPSLFTAGLILAAAAVSLPAADVRDLFLKQLDDMEKKMNNLAEAMPAEKYSWRPAPGVRSVSEVFVHVASANYGFPSMAGVKPPAGFSRDMEKTVTEKSKVQEALKQSFEHARQAAKGLSDADMTKSIKMFGRESNVEALFFTMATHMHEHLGQAIAYARTNGVVPPWSVKN